MIVTADHGQPMLIIGTSALADADCLDRTSTNTISVASPNGTMSQRVYRDANVNIRMQLPYASFGGVNGPPAQEVIDAYAGFGFPDYVDADGDGCPDNREAGRKGRVRLAVGFRTGSHTAATLPISAQGPGAFLFTGVMDQTEVMLQIGAALGSDTTSLDDAVSKMVSNPAYPRTYGK